MIFTQNEIIFAQNEMNFVQNEINFVQNRMSFVQNEIIMLKMIFKKLNLRIIFLILSVFEDRKSTANICTLTPIFRIFFYLINSKVIPFYTMC